MRQNKFESYENYLESQRFLTRKKVARPYNKSATTLEVVDAIVTHHKGIGNVRLGLCHGVRFGEELDMFQNAFKQGEWIGTEVLAELCDGKRILNCDFSHVKNEWLGEFDVIYSNALDHSYDPWKTVKAWIACLSPMGRLYVEWNPWSNKLGGKGGRADCFAASESEYLELFQRAGKVEQVLSVPKKTMRFDRTIFVEH